MKKLFSTLLLTLLMSMIGQQAYATKVQVNGLCYYLDDENLQAQVTDTDSEEKYTGNIEIPNEFTYEGKVYSVTSISELAFYECIGLTSVTIPNSVTSIGESAFYKCSGLTSVTLNSNAIVSKRYTSSKNFKTLFGEQVTEYIIGDSVTSIGELAFYECIGLTSLTIPNYVTSIGERAFEGCYGLASVTIGNSVSIIGGSAFSLCSKLASLTISNSVTSIGQWAFSDCSSLTSVTIPNSVTSIGKDAFKDCSGLTSVTLNSNAIVSKTYTSSSIKSFFGEQVSEYIIGDSVTSIGPWAFSDCYKLNSVVIPNSVTSIGKSAFEKCYGLTSISIGNNVTTIDERAFLSCHALTSVTLPNSVTSIGDGAFCECKKLTSVTLPDSLATIGVAAFCSCENLTSVIIPNNVTSIGERTFLDCSNLTSVTLSNRLTDIGEKAFWGCSKLASIVIPNTVMSIGNSAFEGCLGLQKVIVYDIAVWCSIFFANERANPLSYANHIYSDENTEIKDLVIPDGVTDIEFFAFYGCSGLTSVLIPNGVTSIGYLTFSGCSKLTSVTVLNPTPIAISDFVFSRDTYSNATLYVPKGSKEAYQAANFWKKFKDIIEIDASGIDQIINCDKNHVTIFTLDGKRSNKIQKGINIINGKKVVVK